MTPNSRRKFVHELYAFYDNVLGTPYGYTFRSILYLRIKLEWLGKKGWKTAGDQRDITYNINYSLKFYFSPYIVATPPGYHTGTLATSSTIRKTSQLDLVIYQTSGHHDNGYPNPLWDVEINGSIYQKITSDLAGKGWTNSGYPLW